MPIYEYQCEACEHRFEKIQKFSDEPLADCPECHKPELKKLISAAGFQLKGQGWYVTDFKDKKTTKEPKIDSKEPSKSASSSPSAASSQSAPSND